MEDYIELPSIAYYIYQQLFRIFKSNSEIYTRLDVVNNDLEANKTDLININGYSIINERVKQFLNAKPLVDKLTILFKEAMEKFDYKLAFLKLNK